MEKDSCDNSAANSSKVVSDIFIAGGEKEGVHKEDVAEGLQGAEASDRLD